MRDRVHPARSIAGLLAIASFAACSPDTLPSGDFPSPSPIDAGAHATILPLAGSNASAPSAAAVAGSPSASAGAHAPQSTVDPNIDSDAGSAGLAADGGTMLGTWTTTWATSLIRADSGAGRSFSAMVLRQTLRTSLAGERLRVRFSNEFGSAPLHLGAAHVALRAGAAAIDPTSDRSLQFSGQASVTIEAGAALTSDPVDFALPALSDLAVSIELPDGASGDSFHATALQTSYTSTAGHIASEPDLPGATSFDQWFFLESLDVYTPGPSHAVVALGDSITDGAASSSNGFHRWPDVLARRLAAAGFALGVANEGYSGNQLLMDGAGQSALTRFDRDVLGRSGVSHVIVLEGINDIGAKAATTAAVEDALSQLITRGHAAGLTMIGATLTPLVGSSYDSSAHEQVRVAVNAFIRSGAGFDAVIDLDAVTRDPTAPTQLTAADDSGDHLHPSDTGYEAMGNAIDLKLFE
jgi:lysophospholipase L1-like esterase